ncbi:Helicase required for RNAi-mediated heterochromatin assembly 1 [Erysiphe neolycopersici]|uniref:Helicase required for RNAi-mediated heterochromatin assembly 1 n=1 Tax=Erysiphe neolycopersici TaxID=212602 RepID=A0A420HS83_9PEZI|nr:Helicase required for RNAi-mediated heterochromatin assembly 1 [Erysiphe neolycopersici]
MHPLCGTKRGGAFLNNIDETHIVSDSSAHSNITTSQAYKILKAHYQVKNFIDELPTEESWRNLPEVPSIEEIMDSGNSSNLTLESEDWNEYQNDLTYYPKLPQNIVNRPWKSTKEYIAAHYKILREDAIASLRDAVQTFKRRPNMLEEDRIYIYTEVTITGWFLTRQGPACRVEFCVDRSEKRVRWEQSRRLLQGSIVALSNFNNLFKTDCRIAVVAGRSIEGGLDQSPPTIDLFFGDNEKIELDPHEKYVMLEAREGYFEASRHMLIAMQKLVTEKFPLQNEIVFLDHSVKAPQYLLEQPCLNITWLGNSSTSSAVKPSENKACDYLNVNILEDFPFKLDIGMDESQMQALQAMITRKVAIVQGPPGTGKTHVSVSALGLMISNLRPGDPPIIVAAQTNHALDQLLSHVMKFEPNIVRLGGQSARKNTHIRERTLYELHSSNQVRGRDGGMGKCRKELSRLVEKIKVILAPLLTDDLLTLDQLIEYKVITEKQRESFSAANWVGNENSDNEVTSWLGDDQIMYIKRASPVNLGLPLEEENSEYEKKIDIMDVDKDLDDQFDSNSGELIGSWIPYLRKYTGRHVGTIDSKKWRRRLSKIKDIYEIHENERGIAYRYFEMRVNSCILKTFKSALKEYQKLVHEFQIVRALRDIELLAHIGIKVIGCTTSGLAKYRGMLSALQPRILLIEEAAETLEGKVMAGTPESIQQIIMVGDHQQLQASCTIRMLEEEPYNMKVSMFERLIYNNFPYVILNKQRRMITEIRKLLCIKPRPFYENLYDHESVLDRDVSRPPVPGMGGKNTYFFHHNWPEARNLEGSCYNEYEAEMAVAFFNYLYLNGLDPSKITILTFYKGQKNLILKYLRNHATLVDIIYFNVHTVDSYQGEENDVILLSLVRSNTQQSIGFLDNKNRLVVALSRARRGLYLFGNSVTLTFGESEDPKIGRELLWLPLIMYMGSQRRYDLDKGLPITCSRHQNITMIHEAGDFAKLSGGCTIDCDRGPLLCRHKCPLKCHAFEHGNLSVCTEPCSVTLICGHLCSRKCSMTCFCDKCDQRYVDSKEVDALKTKSESQITKTGCLDIFSDEKKYYTREGPMKLVETSTSTVKKKSIKEKSHDIKKVGQLSRPESDFRKLSPNHNIWRQWDASKADHVAIEQQKVREGNKIANSPIEYHDSHKNVIVRNGQRMIGKVSQMIIETTNPEPHRLKTTTTANSKFTSENLPSKDSTTNLKEKSTGEDQLLIDLKEDGDNENFSQIQNTNKKINTVTRGLKGKKNHLAPEISIIGNKEPRHLLD